ncbi:MULTISPECIES: hypothetical protein [Pseudomonas]|jgi:hypothetical protein|uniref:Uncharacterized protein n=1 Tax=Pseudomonas flavocrustae TaxID=2991719 RepID=A0ABT6ICJ4_9PSED|nr:MULTISPECIES: hypothetical protein [Pseudomonas]MDH4762258.1 hypothetical protein [Pseudomonas sp. CBMAI 2609]MDK8265121.1 hypothetical protein [Pseudomonas oryzihabitans]QNQ98782.1 hypothetical protein BGI51_14440 [Pseudomonas psychrotolerans]
MGIRILASVIATFAAFHAEAATLPAVPPLKLADLTLQVPLSSTDAIPARTDAQLRDSRQPVNGARWLNEHRTLAQEQRWVF